VQKQCATPLDEPGKPGYCSSNDSISVPSRRTALSGFAPNRSFRAPATSLQRAQAQSSFRAYSVSFLGDPNFLYAALDTTVCAAFIKESRMNCASANRLHRKIRGPRTGRNETVPSRKRGDLVRIVRLVRTLFSATKKPKAVQG
jgi:hypothetical protein